MATGIDVAASIGGLLSLAFEAFHGCVRAYQFFYRAQNIGNEGDMIRSRLRWEQYRTQDWAKRAGLEAGTPLETLNWLIVSTILRDLEAVLTKRDLLKMKYSFSFEKDISPSDGPQVEGSAVAPAKGLGKFIARLSPESLTASSPAILSKDSTSERLKWAITDRNKARVLTDHISELNDRLMYLLDSAEREAVDLATSSLLSDYISQSSLLDEVQEAQQLLASSAFKKHHVLAEVARLKSIRLCTGADKRADEQQPAPPQGGPPSWMPKLRKLNRKKFESVSGDSSSPCSRLEFARYDGRQVVVEWKMVPGSLWRGVQDQVQRLCLLLSGLIDDASRENSFHCLGCIGYLPWEEKGRYGLLYELPQNTVGLDSSNWNYRCLRCLLSQLNRASLNDRHRIGLGLAQTMLRLHTAGWLHKGIRSENMFFFVPSEKAELSNVIRSPMYLLGYGYARTDDEEGADLTQYVNTPARLEIYKHPEYRGRQRRPFRKQFDMYGLGCVLLELAYWKPLVEIYPTFFTKQIGTQISDADKNNKEIKLPSFNELAAKYPESLPGTSHRAGTAFSKAITRCLYMPAASADGAETSLETQKSVVDLLEQCCY